MGRIDPQCAKLAVLQADHISFETWAKLSSGLRETPRWGWGGDVGGGVLGVQTEKDREMRSCDAKRRENLSGHWAWLLCICNPSAGETDRWNPAAYWSAF